MFFKKFKKFILAVILPIFLFSCKPSANKKPLVVLNIEGGICSQIFFYYRGKYLEEQGYNVKWDLTWFGKHEKIHTNDPSTRNFELKKAFPTIKLNIASQTEIDECKKSNFINVDTKKKIKGVEDIKIKSNSYITGYGARYYNYENFMRESFNPILDNATKKWFDIIINDKDSCGVHVRRGDLSDNNAVYGSPAPVEYFIEAIKFLRKKNPNMSFYFFSEEKDWIRENIVPKLTEDIKYYIVDANNANNGYLDLFLLSKCKYIVGSHGSFGDFAHMLSNNSIYISYRVNKDNWQSGEFVLTE